jgi:predicted nucleic acid-binding protein
VRVVVCDAGPVIHLSEAGALGLLERAGEVLIPPTVDREVARHLEDWTSRRPRWLRVEAPEHPTAEQLAQWSAPIDVGAGELEAIVLAKARTADWLLTDDAAARVMATLLGIEVHGSLGVVLWAAALAHISQQGAASILDRLAASSLWISPIILAEARRALNALSRERP